MTARRASKIQATRAPRGPSRGEGGERASYHHGDLRNALVQAGLERLERDGADGLSLRAIAADVGVSHAAPAHHFGTLSGLRTALATIGFARFGAGMRAARERAGPEPEAQMRAVGVSYIAVAESSPALFRLMFTAALLDWSDGSLQTAATAAREELIEICRPAADRLGIVNPILRGALERLVWSSVHGYAHLSVSGQFGEECPPESSLLDIAALLFGGPLGLMHGGA